MDVVRWPLAGRRVMTRWHIDAPIAADERGRTQCGVRWPRATATVRAMVDLDDAAVCERCRRAMRGTVTVQE